MPTELKSFRSRPSHAGHSVSGSSEKDCTASSWWPHAVQAYWYVGTFSSGSWHGLLALVVFECQWCVITPGFVQRKRPGPHPGRPPARPPE